MVLALSACGLTKTSPSPTPSSTVTPMPSGLVIEPDAITRIDARLAQMTQDGTFSGSVLIAQDGNILLSRGYGLSDRTQGIPNTPQTRFHLGSITKQFTAMGILILQSQGKLSVQDPICNFIADCPEEWQDITIHHLLTHTSGLSNQLSSQLYQEIESATSGLVAPSERAYYLGLTSQWSLDTQPGERYAYNNFGYILLAQIIEGVSGQSYADFLEQAIFTPLNMRNTGYQDSSSGVAEIYIDSDAMTGVQYGSPAISEGSGHLYSTSEDLFLWDQALYTDQLLPRTDLEWMFEPFVDDIGDSTPGMPATLGFGYGYGWFVGRDQGRPVVAGAGGGPAFATIIMRYPEDKLVAIILTNRGGIDWSFWATISNVLFGEE
jgi:CubicO group peptidase (beta-lactamase class C family)